MGEMSEKFTAVQHSGFGYGGKPEFERGLEVRTVGTEAEQAKVVEAGGVLFDAWSAAEEFCDRAMWPGSRSGLDLVPRALGRFSDTEVGGLRVYIPDQDVTECDAEVALKKLRELTALNDGGSDAVAAAFRTLDQAMSAGHQIPDDWCKAAVDPPYSPEEFADLPQTVRAYLRAMEANLDYTRRRLDPGPQDTRLIADPYSDLRQNLACDQVRFVWPQAPGDMFVNVRLMPEGALRIDSDDTLLIVPSSTNAVVVRPTRRDTLKGIDAANEGEPDVGGS